MIVIVPKLEKPKEVERLAVGVAEAAQMLSISERTLWKWTKEKRVPSVKIGRKVLYPVEGLRQFVNGATTVSDNNATPCDSVQIHATEH